MEPNQTLGPYLLVERLGRGGFSEVWRARPQPERLSQNPAELLPFLEVLQGLLETREKQAPVARLAKNLRENLALLQRLSQRAEEDLLPPQDLQGAHDAAAQALAKWLQELAEAGELDLALKIPFHDGYVRQLRREKDVLSRVSHPNLVKQLTLNAAHEPPYLAMELVEGWSLRDALRQEAIPSLAKVLSVMDQLLGVLDHLHRRGLVHGDVKPENILLEPDGTLRLIDLGLGRISQQVMRDAYLSISLASRVPVMGTLSYMAPEVRQGHEASPRSDLYSAGIVLYEMLVGDVPSGMSLPSQAAPERKLSTRYDVLLKWVLHPEPERRIQTARELRERVLLTVKPRDRHQFGKGRAGRPREGTLDFDQWALAQASPFVAGDWVGDYLLEEPLGRGGFGEVWRAKPVASKPVALKIAIGPHGKEGLVKEAEIAQRLSHEQIPAYVSEDLEHDPPYLVVGFVRGESLRARLNAEGQLEAADAVPLLLSLVNALAHCHERGVVHRDLKPENLLLDDEVGTLHLLDFGLAATDAAVVDAQRARLSDTLETRGLDGGGTFEYMSPERRRGEPGGPPSDVYALGVILFEVLSGQLPRGLTRLRELCSVPRGVEAICERMLRPDPSARPSLAVVAAALGQERPKRPWAGIKRRRGTKPPRGLQRPQLSEWALAGAVALTGVGVSLLVWGGPPLVVASLFATLGVVYLAHGSPPKPGRPRSAHVVGASFLAALVAIGALGHRLQEPPAPPGLTSSKTPGPARAALPSFGARDLDLGAEVLQSRIEQAQTTCDAFDADGFQDRLRLRVARHHLGLLEEILTRRRAAEEEAYLARAATTSSEHATGTALRRLEKRQDAMTSWQRALALDPLHPQAVDWLCSVAIGSHVLRAQVAALEGIPDEIKAHYAAGRLAEGDLLWIHLQHVVPLASGLDAALATRPRPLPDAFARAGQSAYQRALARGDVPGARSVLGRQIEFPTPGGPPPWWEGLPGPELEISLLLLGSRTLFPPRATPTVLAARRVNARAEALNWTRRTLRGRLRKALWHVEVSQLAQPYADCVAPADRIALRELVTGVRTLAGDSIQHAGLPEHFRIVHSKLHDARQRELRERLAWSGLSEQPDLELAGILPAARKRVRAQRAVAWREIELRWAIEGASPEEQP